MKGGSPSVNHGHMDVGSFIMEAKGERWAMDFGMQDYNSLETAGVDLWNMEQNSQRWEVFRYNNFAHNTLTVNNQLQNVNGYAPIISWSDAPAMMNAVTDITSVYKGIAKKVVRGLQLLIINTLQSVMKLKLRNMETVIRWNLLTSAEVTIAGNNSALLTKRKKLTIKVTTVRDYNENLEYCAITHSYDAANPGTIMVGFERNTGKHYSSLNCPPLT